MLADSYRYNLSVIDNRLYIQTPTNKENTKTRIIKTKENKLINFDDLLFLCNTSFFHRIWMMQ